jgi:hypothetical protein
MQPTLQLHRICGFNSYLCNEVLCKLGFSNCPRGQILRPVRGQLEKPNLHRNELHKKLYCLKRRTSPKLPNLLKMISHLLLTVLTNFSRNVTLNVLSRATVGYLLFFALEQLGGSLQRRKMRIYDS